MKERFIITALIAFAFSTASAQNNNMKIASTDSQASHYKREIALGVAILNALKNKNVNEWIALYPTHAEFKSILEVGLAAKVEGLTREKIDTMIERRKKEAAAVYEEQYNGYQHQADSFHIQWKNAVFEKFNFESVYPEEVKLKYLTGDIRFSCKNDHYIIDGVQAVEIEAGYRLQAVENIRKAETGE